MEPAGLDPNELGVEIGGSGDLVSDGEGEGGGGCCFKCQVQVELWQKCCQIIWRGGSALYDNICTIEFVS